MRIVVCSRHVYAVDDEVELNDASTDIDDDFRDAGINEWDQAALEAALRLRDDGTELDIALLTVADRGADPILRRLLAMGADKACRVECDSDLTGDPVATASVLAQAIVDFAPDLVLTGVQTADHSNGATGAALAGLLGWPCLAVVKSFDLDGSNAQVRCELEGGLIAKMQVGLPAVLSIQTGHYLPRYANFRAIKQAEQKELKVVSVEPPEKTLKLRRMFLPQSDNEVEVLGDDPAAVAASIVEIVRELRP